MSGLYVDTSALGRLVLDEPDGPLVAEVLTRYDGSWSSWALALELRRLGLREERGIAVERALAGVNLVPADGAAIERASAIPPAVVRSLDAIHLEAAVRLHASGTVAAVLTFDRQLAAGCAHHGIVVEAPERGR